MLCIGVALIFLLVFAGNAVASAPDPDYDVVLTPLTGTNPVGTEHTVTATVTIADSYFGEVGTPVSGVTVNFEVSGEHTASGFNVTDENGITTFTYSGVSVGTDFIVAYADGSYDLRCTSNIVEKTWTSEGIPEFPTIVIPIAAIIGLAFFFSRRNDQ